jgi:hypothetical protein
MDNVVAHSGSCDPSQPPGKSQGSRPNQEYRKDHRSLQGRAPNELRCKQGLTRRPGVWGGPQTHERSGQCRRQGFRDEAEKRGYIVVVPAAPNDQLFFEGGERIFPEFLKQILADYKIQDNKFPIAGPSNGGIAAFHVASLNPEYFLSITAFPGYLWEETPAHIQAISKMCINMFVGELDPMGWQDAEAGVGVSRQRHDREIYCRKETAAPFGHSRGPERKPAVRSVRTIPDRRRPKADRLGPLATM